MLEPHHSVRVVASLDGLEATEAVRAVRLAPAAQTQKRQMPCVLSHLLASVFFPVRELGLMPTLHVLTLILYDETIPISISHQRLS